MKPVKLKHQREAQTNSEPSLFLPAYNAWVADVEDSADKTLEITPASLIENGLTSTSYEYRH